MARKVSFDKQEELMSQSCDWRKAHIISPVKNQVSTPTWLTSVQPKTWEMKWAPHQMPHYALFCNTPGKLQVLLGYRSSRQHRSHVEHQIQSVCDTLCARYDWGDRNWDVTRED